MNEPKAPRWTIAFLRALARTGDVRTAAEDAGIDHTTAYARRKTHPDFASMWRGALVAHSELAKGKEGEAIPALGAGTFRQAQDEQLSPNGGNAQIKRAAHDRWSQSKEKLFFDELAATANVTKAAKAAGVSTNAVYARRMKQALFRAKWDAVLETGRAAIEMRLVEAANKSFDPAEDLDTGEVQPNVSVAEAIRIVQLHGSVKQKQMVPHPFEEQAASMSESEVDALRKRVLDKFMRLRERERPKLIEAGWSHDEEHDRMVPPGWVRAT